jgi:hypothetical protein
MQKSTPEVPEAAGGAPEPMEQVVEEVLTPKFGKESDLWVQPDEESV